VIQKMTKLKQHIGHATYQSIEKSWGLNLNYSVI
jgi:hypothetical protein